MLSVADEGQGVSILTGIAIAAVIAAVPRFTRIAQRRSKRAAHGRAMRGAGLVAPLLFVAGFVPSIPRPAQVLVAMALIGGARPGFALSRRR